MCLIAIVSFVSRIWISLGRGAPACVCFGAEEVQFVDCPNHNLEKHPIAESRSFFTFHTDLISFAVPTSKGA